MAAKRVLFVCIGNACRSQMAEGFARTYGSDVMIPASAGLSPAMGVIRDTKRAMAEKDIDLNAHFPKSVQHLSRVQFDLVVNMSGSKIPGDLATKARVIEWDVADPVSMTYSDHCEIRDEIERLVMKLITELRRDEAVTPQVRGQGSGRMQP